MFRSYSEKVFRTNLPTFQHSQGEQWFSCDLCDLDDEDAESSWRTETDVELHRKDMHFNYICRQLKENRNRFCTVCMKLQESKSALISHIKQRHLLSSPNAQRVEREIFICEYCDHIFFNKDVLEAHIKYMHLWPHDQRAGKTFSCPRCKKIRQLKSLWFHMQNHDIPSVTICDICLMHCPSMADLMSHVKDHPMFFKCEICNFQTLKDSIFEKHLQGHKTAPVKQDVSTLQRCIADVFTQPNAQSNLVKYNIHHAIKGLIVPPFVRICTLCREICTDKIEMLEHILRDHTDHPEPPKQPSHSCHCGLKFASRVLLKHHTFKTHGLQQKTAANTENQPISTTDSSETNERNEANEQDRNDTEAQQVEIVIGEEPSPEKEMANEESLEMEQEDNSGEELVYIYTTIDDDDMVVEQDSEEIVGF